MHKFLPEFGEWYARDMLKRARPGLEKYFKEVARINAEGASLIKDSPLKPREVGDLSRG
ncbi:MAG TPA: hypothetical protein VK626_01585 [Nitrospiraceae bacterium]|nr:hypothetical protein [Nitrospiraceae bacterium]